MSILAPPEVNRYWRRLMWDNELTRLYTHLEHVSHSIDSHQKKLYLENTFHDQARDRANQLYADKISRENIGLFKRLMAVHTRKPKEFRTHQVQNPKTHSRFLEYQRVMEDNHRLVDRLLQSKTFVNDKGSWDDHAMNHEQILLRLSHAPKNVFVPNLHSKRRQEQRRARELTLSQQARKRIAQKSLPQHQQQAQQLERVEQMVAESGIELSKTWSGEVLNSPSNKKPIYHYPLPPSSIPDDPTNLQSVRHAAAQSSHGAPPVLLPYGTHLVAPALVDEDQYAAIQHNIVSNQHTPQVLSPKGRVYSTTGTLQDVMFTMPMPPPSPRRGEQQEADAVFYLRPHSHRPRSLSPPSHTRTSSTIASTAAVQPVAQEAEPIAYPFAFPALDSTAGSAVDFARKDYQQLQQEHQQEIPSEYAPPRAIRTAETDSMRQQQSNQTYTNDSFDPSQQPRATTSYAAARPFTHATQQTRYHQQQQQQFHQPQPPSRPSHSLTTSSSPISATPHHLSSPPSQKFLDYFSHQNASIRNFTGANEFFPVSPTDLHSARGRTARHKFALPSVRGSAAATSDSNDVPSMSMTTAAASGRSSLNMKQTSAYSHSTTARHQTHTKENRRKTATQALEHMLDMLIQPHDTTTTDNESHVSSTTKSHTPATARTSHTNSASNVAKLVEEEKTVEPQPLSAVA